MEKIYLKKQYLIIWYHATVYQNNNEQGNLDNIMLNHSYIGHNTNTDLKKLLYFFRVTIQNIISAHN